MLENVPQLLILEANEAASRPTTMPRLVLSITLHEGLSSAMAYALTGYDLDCLNAKWVCVDLADGILLITRSVEALQPAVRGS